MATEDESPTEEEALEVPSDDPPPSWDEAVVAGYLSSHPEFAKDWFSQHASQEMVNEWLHSRGLLYSDLWSLPELEQGGSGDLSASYAEVTRNGRNSVTTELFRDMVAGPRRRHSSWEKRESLQYRTQLRNMNENELFTELIRDISNELDIDTLCHKILVNVSILTHSDRGSLFLARGSRGQRCLVAKLFDVTPDSVLEDAISAAEKEHKVPPIPFGVGIAGHVALTKETVNIKDAYQDSRFNKEVDVRTGYRTVSMMCMPILNYHGDVIGVAQCINKVNGDSAFAPQDEEVFRRYLAFCGIGIQNAQLFEMSVQEYKRNQLLLKLAQSIFEESSSLERLISKIMIEAQGLLQCQHCRVYLVDLEQRETNLYEKEHFSNQSNHLPATKKPRKFSKPENRRSLLFKKCISANQLFLIQTKIPRSLNRNLVDFFIKDVMFSTVFELRTAEEDIRKLRPTEFSTLDPGHVCLAKRVAATGQTNNLLSQDDNIQVTQEVMKVPGNILSIPIFDRERKVIGVAQLVDKCTGEAFVEIDIATFEAFSIFCGIGIHNTQMYESAIKLMAKQRVALEVLSYHASSSLEETNRLMKMHIPSGEKFELGSFRFSDLSLSDEETCLATIRMFLELDLIVKFHIPYQVLCRWVLSVKKNYRPVIYHNWRHAFNVTQTMFSMLTTGEMGIIMSDLEVLALIVACLCHDLDHRGTNNSFQTKIDSPLATLYSTSTMEHHHFDQSIMILNSEGNNILQSLSPEDYRKAIRVIETAILSTDLALYFKKKDSFYKLIEMGNVDWKDFKSKELLRGMMMTACDVSAICKPWDVQSHVAELVASEFFQQGDLEKECLKEKPIAMMDREKKDELPKMQVNFIDCVCMPVYKVLSECWPALRPLYEGCMNNRHHWLQQIDLANEDNEGTTISPYYPEQASKKEITSQANPQHESQLNNRNKRSAIDTILQRGKHQKRKSRFCALT